MARKSSAKLMEQSSNKCPRCKSEYISVMHKWQYFYFITILPVIVGFILAIVYHPIAYAFLLIIFLINYIVAVKKTPLIQCRGCRFIGKQK